jgi:hypothetical protein
MAKDNQPKLHTTKGGKMVVEYTTKDAQGKPVREFRDFNPSTFHQIRQVQTIAQQMGLTGKTVDVLGRKIALDSDEPFAFEFNLLAELDNHNLLDTKLGEVLRGKPMQQVLQNEMQNMQGAPQESVDKRMLDSKLRFLAAYLNRNPKARTDIIETLNQMKR